MAIKSGRAGLLASTSGAESPEQAEKHHPFILFTHVSPPGFVATLTENGAFDGFKPRPMESCYHKQEPDIRADAALLRSPMFDALAHLLVGPIDADLLRFNEEVTPFVPYDESDYPLMEGTPEVLRNLFFYFHAVKVFLDGKPIAKSSLLGYGVDDLARMIDLRIPAGFDVLEYFTVPRLHEGETLPLTQQRVFNIIENNFFYSRAIPKAGNAGKVYLRVDSIAINFLHIQLAARDSSLIDLARDDALFLVDGVRYISVSYKTFLDDLIVPWFMGFLNSARRNNGDFL